MDVLFVILVILIYLELLQVATESPLALSRVSSIGIGRGDLLYRLHGALMLVAWLGCAGAGMILAR